VSNGARFLLATVCGLVLAGIVHLAAVLALPWLGENDALAHLRETLNSDQVELVALPGGRGGPGGEWLPRPDPAAAVGACAYNLREGPARISARTGPLFQSLSAHARGGTAFYAVTDRAAVRGALDLVLLTEAQRDEILAREDEDEISRDVRVVAPGLDGYVLVRVLAGLPSQRAEAEEAARSVACTVDTLPEPR
jgi:uncharacterized membrane protein